MLCAISAGPDPNNKAGMMLIAKAPPMMLIKYRMPALLANFISPPPDAGPIWRDSILVADMTAINFDSFITRAYGVTVVGTSDLLEQAQSGRPLADLNDYWRAPVLPVGSGRAFT